MTYKNPCEGPVETYYAARKISEIPTCEHWAVIDDIVGGGISYAVFRAEKDWKDYARKCSAETLTRLRFVHVLPTVPKVRVEVEM